MHIKFISSVILSIVISGFSSFAEEQKTDSYPLKSCVVSGESLDSMGGAYIYKHNDREVRFCCKRCIKKFLKDPGTYLAKIDAAAAEQKAEPVEKDAVKKDNSTQSHEQLQHK